ncbi:MAG: hypothetical protein HRT54_17965 [Colwellia sp.]|nr:hypothetical protein [Colwellia sp.]
MENNIDNNEQQKLMLHKTNIKKNMTHKHSNKLRNVFAVSSLFIATSFLATGANALEVSGEFHKGSESKTQGYSFALADTFTKGGNIYWTVGYSSLDKVKVEWNNDELFFNMATVDALVSYRHKIQSYNSFFKNLTIEYKVGASFGLTENKFTWPETPGLEEEVRYFSEESDINPIIGVGAYYKLNRNTSINVGVKYQPSFSEFGAITSAYVGITYRFGRGLDR